MAKDTKTRPLKPNRYTRILTILVLVVLITLVCCSFFSKGYFAINNGMIVFMLLATVLALAETFDQFNIGSIFSIKRELKETKKEAMQLRRQLTQITAVGVKGTQTLSFTNNVGATGEKTLGQAPAPGSSPPPEKAPPESDDGAGRTSTSPGQNAREDGPNE